MLEVVKKERRSKLTLGISRYHDALSYRSCTTMATISKAEVELIKHISYSPNIIPS